MTDREKWEAAVRATKAQIAGTPVELIEHAAILYAARRLEAAEEVVEALKFYADPQNYLGPNQREGNHYRIDVTRDNGERARKAIARYEEG